MYFVEILCDAAATESILYIITFIITSVTLNELWLDKHEYDLIVSLRVCEGFFSTM